MATTDAMISFLAEQLEHLPRFRTRKMFGEYAVYLDEMVVGFVCDDDLFLKQTEAVRDMLSSVQAVDEAPAYPGSKLYFRITADRWEDREWLSELVRATWAQLPPPKPKKPRRT